MCTTLVTNPWFKNVWKTKFNQDVHVGPYSVDQVQNKEAVRAREGNIADTYNLCSITPFKKLTYTALGIVEYGQ